MPSLCRRNRWALREIKYLPSQQSEVNLGKMQTSVFCVTRRPRGWGSGGGGSVVAVSLSPSHCPCQIFPLCCFSGSLSVSVSDSCSALLPLCLRFCQFLSFSVSWTSLVLGLSLFLSHPSSPSGAQLLDAPQSAPFFHPHS